LLCVIGITTGKLTPNQSCAELEHWLTNMEKDLNVIGWQLEEMVLNKFQDIYDKLENLVSLLLKEGFTSHAKHLIDIAILHIPKIEQLCIVEMDAENLKDRFEALQLSTGRLP